ncbi:hypothetical protein ABZ807_20190 [Micromonospora sp. NPDC047548]|uniref:hypothetical protein n=1 Tax=Micromonospora sp. NPDC047548 TaxID=3155624 RepID=UPI0033E72BE5
MDPPLPGGLGATLTVVSEALIEWRGWLEELVERFDRYLPLVTDDRADVALDAWERAVAHLVTVVVDRTCADGGWQHHCRQVLGWFLTLAGLPPQRHEPLVEHAIGGRFDSFVTPPDRLIRDLAIWYACSTS